MTGVLAGFAVIGLVIAVGYIVERRGVLGAHGRTVLARAGYQVAAPALMFTTLSSADFSVIFSPSLVVVAAAAVATVAVFAAVGLWRRWGTGPTTVGALAAAQVNAGNLGIPIAVYALHDAAAVAPVLLFQFIVLVPAALAVLDASVVADGRSWWRRLVRPFSNPVLIAAAVGVLFAGTGWSLPQFILEPITLLGQLSIPAILLAYGMSLRGSSIPGLTGQGRAPVMLAVSLKLLIAPAIACLVGMLLHLDGPSLLAVVVLAGLPTAQNLFGLAVSYRTGEDLARQVITLTTVLSVPVLIGIAALLG